MPTSLRLVTGPLRGQVLTLTPGQVMKAGRDAECGLRLDEANVSRVHAQLTMDAVGGLSVTNLSTTNGIFVNGQRQEKAQLRANDVLAIGSSAIKIEIPTSPANVVPVDGVQDLLACLLEIQKLLGQDADKMVERSLETLFLALPVTRLSLFTLDEHGDPVQGPTSTRGSRGTSMSQGFARRVLAANRAVLIDASEHLGSAEWGRTLQEQDVRSILGVPVFVAGKAVAVLLCDNLDEPGRLNQTHVRVLEFFSKALENVFQRNELRRLERRQVAAENEYLAARKVQDQLFNKAPPEGGAGLRWVTHYQPALELGGDFYDHFENAGGITWVIADVSGKGVAAALVVSMLKAFCKTLYAQDLSPSRFVLALNQLMLNEMPGHMFFTAIVLRVARDGTVTWCNVGHPAGFIQHADGSVIELAPIPGMLGMWPEAMLAGKLTDGAAMIKPGERICVFTDGLTEAMDKDHELFGNERVAEALSAARGSDPGQAVAAMISAAAAFNHLYRFEDDITIILGEA